MKKIITVLVALGITFAAIAPANAWYRGGWGYGGYYGGWGGYGAGLGIMAGSALLGGVIGGAIANGGYGYGRYPYGYGYAYPQTYYVPVQPRVQTRVYNYYYDNDDFGW